MKIFSRFLAFLVLFSAPALFSMSATASSVQDKDHPANLAVDGNMQTRWSSEFADSQWLLIDLESVQDVTGLTIYWEAAFCKAYDISVSADKIKWTRVFTENNGRGSVDDIYFGRKSCRYIRLDLKKRGTAWGNSIYEVKVKGLDQEIVIKDSSGQKNIDAALFDGDSTTSVTIPENQNAYLTLASPKGLSFSAVALTWGKDFAKQYSLEYSDDGKVWKRAFEKTDGQGGTEVIPVSLIGMKNLRIALQKSADGKGYVITDLKFRSWKETSMKNGLDMKRTIVGDEGYPWVTFTAPDGTFAPEPFSHQVSYWLMDEKNKRIYTPETMECSWKLKEGRYPVSISEWEQSGIKGTSVIFAKKNLQLNRLITYNRITVKNTGKEDASYDFLFVIRQNPLCVKWNTSLQNISFDGKNMISINDKPAFFMKENPVARVSTAVLADLPVHLALIKPNEKIQVGNNGTEGALIPYTITLKPGEEKSFDSYSLSGESDPIASESISKLDFDKALSETVEYWKNRASIVFDVPDKEYSDCYYSSIYYILIMMKDNGKLYPGAYNYKSYFLHDAVEMVGALEKSGIHDVGKLATLHFNPKNYGGYGDEMGGSIYGYYEHYRLTKDLAFLKESFPLMRAGCEMVKQLRKKQMTENDKGTAWYGLMPKSMSQDNFTIPAYLYVDDWWTIMALKASLEAARILGDDSASWISTEYEDLLKCTLDSIRLVMKQEKIDYMTGFADYWPPSMRKVDAEHRILGDTQVAWAHRAALFPGQSLGVNIPMDLFKHSYDHYWKKAGAFSDYDGGWFVEYEGLFWGYNVQLAHPMMFLDMQDVTLKNIKWSLDHQCCPGGWCEAMNTVVNEKGLRVVSDGIIGDVPHGWTAAYYAHLLRNMLFREESGKLVLLNCVPPDWFQGDKRISIKKAPTYFGEFNMEVVSDASLKQIKIAIDMPTQPEDGFLLQLPAGLDIKSVEVNGLSTPVAGKKSINLKAGAKIIVLKY